MEILVESDRLIRAEEAPRAIKLLEKYLLFKDHPLVWMKLGRAYQISGNEVVSKSIFRNVVLRSPNPHIVNIIAAQIPFCKPVVIESAKIIYFNIPKCASCSMKDALLICLGEAERKEASHVHVAKFEKVLPFTSLDDLLTEYITITVLRHPLLRLRSYWLKNIGEESSLRREAGGKSIFYDLNTKPTYEEILTNFCRYRQVFLDFRHHTDSSIGYLGRNASRIHHRIDILQAPHAFEILAGRFAIPVPTVWNMRSEGTFDASHFDLALEKSVIGANYDEELKIYLNQN